MKPMKSMDMYPDFLNFQDIKSAQSAEDLRKARLSGQNWLLEMQNSVEFADWSYMVNRMHDEIGRKAVELCRAMMEEAGFGQPPARYAFIVFGSLGREEGTLWSDQDHGLILGDELEPGQEHYFQQLGQRITDMLLFAGYPLCSGKVMCSEAAWRRKLTDWSNQLDEWSSDSAWEPTRHFIIASDMRHVTGSQELSDAWQASFQNCVQQKTDLVQALLRNTVRHKSTLNLMGQVVTERFGEHAGDFDVKYGLYIPLVNSTRTLALQRGITESSTRKRMEKIMLLEGGNSLLENVQHAFMNALILRSSTPIHFKDGFATSSGYISKEQLKDRKFQYELKNTLGVVRRIHRSLQRELRMMERKDW